MLPLIRALFDICLLKKGPDEIPRAWLLLYMSLALWVFAVVATTAIAPSLTARDAWIAVASQCIGLFCFVVAIDIAGFGSRRLQCVTALIGCGALITFAMLASGILLSPFTGPLFAWLVQLLILLWSVPVKGHIIARTINWHLNSGIILAASVLALQFVFTRAMAN